MLSLFMWVVFLFLANGKCDREKMAHSIDTRMVWFPASDDLAISSNLDGYNNRRIAGELRILGLQLANANPT